MNPWQLIRSAVTALGLGALTVPAAAQNALEIIALRHRTADQVLPALRPLAEPGAVLSGRGNQLFVRTSAANLAELLRALEAMDRPSQRLQLLVRFDDSTEASSSGIHASGRLGTRSSRVEVRAHDSSSVSSERVDQRILVMEGARAFIATGQSTPILQGAAITETVTGFDAVPRVTGERVQIEIAPRRETASQQQYLATTLHARLGEWVEVAAALESAARGERALTGAAQARSAASRRVWLKVEELRP
jgi:hypothetical protein